MGEEFPIDPNQVQPPQDSEPTHIEVTSHEGDTHLGEVVLSANNQDSDNHDGEQGSDTTQTDESQQPNATSPFGHKSDSRWDKQKAETIAAVAAEHPLFQDDEHDRQEQITELKEKLADPEAIGELASDMEESDKDFRDFWEGSKQQETDNTADDFDREWIHEARERAIHERDVRIDPLDPTEEGPTFEYGRIAREYLEDQLFEEKYERLGENMADHLDPYIKLYDMDPDGVSKLETADFIQLAHELAPTLKYVDLLDKNVQELYGLVGFMDRLKKVENGNVVVDPQGWTAISWRLRSIDGSLRGNLSDLDAQGMDAVREALREDIRRPVKGDHADTLEWYTAIATIEGNYLNGRVRNYITDIKQTVASKYAPKQTSS